MNNTTSTFSQTARLILDTNTLVIAKPKSAIDFDTYAELHLYENAHLVLQEKAGVIIDDDIYLNFAPNSSIRLQQEASIYFRKTNERIFNKAGKLYTIKNNQTLPFHHKRIKASMH